MLAHFQHAAARAVQTFLQRKMPKRHFHTIAPRGRRPFPARQRAGDFIKYPRIALRRARDQHCIASGLFAHPNRIRAGAHIAVAEYGHGDAFFDLRDDVPVRCAGVLLAARSSMHGDRRRARLFADLRHLNGVDVIRIPARADFDRDGLLRRIRHRAHDAADAIGIVHHRAALAISGDFRRGTTKVHIEEFKARAFQTLHRVRHDAGIAAEKLQRSDLFPFKSGEQLLRRAIFALRIDPALRGQHFTHAPRHGCERRALRQGKISDLHHVNTLPSYMTLLIIASGGARRNENPVPCAYFFRLTCIYPWNSCIIIMGRNRFYGKNRRFIKISRALVRIRVSIAYRIGGKQLAVR